MAKNTPLKKPRKNFLLQHLLPEKEGGVYESSRVRSAKLRARMMRFNKIYNAAWMVRHAQHGTPEQREAKVREFINVLRRELEKCRDPEALIFAVADSITAFPHGLPWEG